MPQALAFIAPSVFGVGGSLALFTTTAAGLTTLTLAGSLVSIGGSLLINAALNELNRPDPGRPDNIQINTKLGTAARVGHVGIVKAGGNAVYHRAFEGVSYRLFVHGHGEIDATLAHYLNNEQVAIDGSGFVTEGQYQHGGRSRVRFFERLGVVPSPYYSEIEDVDAGWTSLHRLDGMWTSLVFAESVPPDNYRDMYPNGEPQVQIKARTAKFHDPRGDLTAFTENAALIINGYVSSPDGFNRPGAIDPADLTAAADIADQEMPLAAGGTEARFRLSGSYLLTERPQDVLTRMMTACGARMRLKPSGLVGLKMGAWAAPEYDITFDQVLEIRSVEPGPDLLDRFNALPARYVDHSLDHVEIDAEIWRDTARIATDGEELPGPQLNAIMSPSHRQTRQVMKIETERRNPSLSLDLLLKPKALPAIYEDAVVVTLPELGVTGFAEIRRFDLIFKDGLLQAVSLRLDMIDSGAFSQTLSEQGQQQSLPPEQEGGGLPVPQSFVAAGVGVLVAQNSYSAGIGVGWAAAPSDALSPRLRYAPAGTTDWVEVTLSAGAVNGQIGGLVDGNSYDLDLAWVSPTGQVGPAATVTATATAASNPPAAPTGLTVTDETGGVALVEMTASASNTLWKTEVYRDAVLVGVIYSAPGAEIAFYDNSGAGTFDWTARSVNVSNIDSTSDAGPVNATIA